jgi:hypothetical protein
VACSFLCLVGVVVFYKYRQPAPNRLVAETPVSGLQPARFDFQGNIPEVTPADSNSQPHPSEPPALPPGPAAPGQAPVPHPQPHREPPTQVAQAPEPPPPAPALPTPTPPPAPPAPAALEGTPSHPEQKAAEAEKQHESNDVSPPALPGPEVTPPAVPGPNKDGGDHEKPKPEEKESKRKPSHTEKKPAPADSEKNEKTTGDKTDDKAKPVPPSEPVQVAAASPGTGAEGDKQEKLPKEKQGNHLPAPQDLGVPPAGQDTPPAAAPVPPGLPGAGVPTPPVPAAPPPGAPAPPEAVPLPPPPGLPVKDVPRPSESEGSEKKKKPEPAGPGTGPVTKPEEKAAPPATREGADLGAPPPLLSSEKTGAEPPPAHPGHPAEELPAKKTGSEHAAPEGTLTGATKPATDPAAKPTPATDPSKPEAVGVSVAAPPAVASPPGVAPAKVIPTPPVADDAPAGSQPPAPAHTEVAQRPAGTKPLPPLGAAPTSIAPAIVVSSPTSSGPPPPTLVTPRVESFDEEVHTCQAGDNFAQISKQYYKTEAYANALLMYNRNHGQASPSVQKDPPELKTGDTLFIPPTAILEKRHPTLIPGLTPLPTPGPAAAGVTAHSSPAPTMAQQTAAKYAVYRVVSGNEGMFTIAQRALKDGMRWIEIARLNPTFNPSRPVPPNTILYLPADARVPPENVWQQP